MGVLTLSGRAGLHSQLGCYEHRVIGDWAQVTALWVTHRLEELAFADAASFMDNGRVQVRSSQHPSVTTVLDKIFLGSQRPPPNFFD